MAAPCGSCGGQVMTWKKAFFLMRPTTKCDQCGEKVRLRWGKTYFASMFSMGAIAGILAYAAFDYSLALIVIAAVIVAVALTAGWYFWKVLPWDPVAEKE